MPGKSGSSNKRIIIYAVMGILVVAAFSVAMLGRNPASNNDEIQKNLEESRQQQLQLFRAQYCGQDAVANSNAYVTEYVLPNECEMPFGITAEGDSVYYTSSKNGSLGLFADGKFQEFLAPSWPTRSNPIEFSMTWAAKTDSAGNVWFTDDKANLLWRFNKAAGTFDSFNAPAAQPISFDFDSDGNMYLVGVRSASLFFGEVSKMKSGTSDGFTEINLPLDGFKDVTEFKISSGSVVVDKERNAVWTSVLAFQEKGQVFRYDTVTKQIRIYDLPQELNSPVGLTVDDSGNVWVTDHGTSVFFKLDPASGSLTKYTTSVASDRIYGGPAPPNAYTLPYWIEKAPDGAIWFNQHFGNKISRFDTMTDTMVEYWIPTQNEKNWNCPENATSCGIANALQFSVGPDGQVWFTEWTENKIGRIDSKARIPFSVSADDDVTVRKGDSTEIKVTVNSLADVKGKMAASGTFTNTGQFGSSTGIFSESDVSLTGESSKQVSFVLTPAADLASGQYILMLGMDTGDVAVLKAVRVNVI